eukprot:TRINITY_DN44401_c0_g1_i1.p1 TRINITY_DN44401_c0_g1~~TRINITY_DN44401_c0_g1_i1.p1  ORF type:complete len:116 (-),score=13.20 TRINITY_DN44401_c0_g1_i1:372-689(-)
MAREVFCTPEKRHSEQAGQPCMVFSETARLWMVGKIAEPEVEGKLTVTIDLLGHHCRIHVSPDSPNIDLECGFPEKEHDPHWLLNACNDYRPVPTPNSPLCNESR